MGEVEESYQKARTRLGEVDDAHQEATGKAGELRGEPAALEAKAKVIGRFPGQVFHLLDSNRIMTPDRLFSTSVGFSCFGL